MSTPIAVDETERERLIAALETILDPYADERTCSAAADLLRADAAEIAALRKDAERLDWLDSHEYDVVCHVETWCCEEGEYSIWWNVTDGEKSISGHPMGSARDAIDAAIALRTSPPDDQRGTK